MEINPRLESLFTYITHGWLVITNKCRVHLIHKNGQISLLSSYNNGRIGIQNDEL